MPIKRALFAVLALLAAGTAMAAPLTWEDCRRQALEGNPDYRAAKRSEQAASAGFYNALNGLLPGLTASDSYGRSSGSTDSSYSLSFSARMDLFNMSEYISVRQEFLAMEAARARLKQASAQARLALRTAFVGLLFAQQNVRMSEEIVALRERDADLVGLKYQSGYESRGNSLRLAAELESARAALASAKRNVLVARQQLVRQLGGKPGEAVEVTGEFTTSTPFDQPPDTATLLAKVPAVRIARLQLDTTRASLASAQSPILPTLSASYSRSRTTPDPWLGVPENWSAGATLSWNILSSGPLGLPLAWLAARRQAQEQEENTRAAELQAAVTLQSGWSSFSDAVDDVRVQNLFLAAAEQQAKEADVRYSSGLLSFENWEPITSSYTNYQRSALSTMRDAVVAEAQWNAVLGRGLEEQ